MTHRRKRHPLDQAKAIDVARRLIERDCRSTVVCQITGLPRVIVAEIHETVKGHKPRPGKLTERARNVLTRKHLIGAASIFATGYLSEIGDLKLRKPYDLLETHQTDPYLFLDVYDETNRICALDCTTAWLTLRDIRVREIELRYCRSCQAYHLQWLDTTVTSLQSCIWCAYAPSAREERTINGIRTGIRANYLAKLDTSAQPANI